MSNIAFYGGSFNPPTIAHEAIIAHLIEQSLFAKVIVKPCGTRLDKPELTRSQATRKKVIIEKLSRPQSHYFLDLSAMDEPMTPTIIEWKNLKNQYPQHEVLFVAGTDLFVLENDGCCQIQKWVEGETLFRQAHFYIYPRPVEGKIAYPPNHIKVENFQPINISSSEIRKHQALDQS